MPLDTAHQRLNEAWKEVVQQKANADAAIADQRWRDATKSARQLRWACSELECAIDEVAALEAE